MAVTPAIILEHLETDLGDNAIQRLIDEAEAYCTKIAGPESGSYTVHRQGGVSSFWLRRPADSITSVTELDNGDNVVDSGNYRLEHGGRTLRRVGNIWAHGTVEIVYTVITDTAVRDRVVIDLVHLALSYRGAVKSESDGAYSSGRIGSPDAYERERYNIASALVPTTGILV